MPENQWIFAPILPETEALVRELGAPLAIARILANRDLLQPEKARDFLYAGLESMHDPYLLAGMGASVDRLFQAVQCREKVLIFGDYDVDGVLSVVVLTRALQSLGIPTDYYIPDRLKEGYGLKDEHIEIVRSKKADIVISVDCGIKAIDFVNGAKTLGVDVIITDHHQPGDELPDALAVLNPVLPDSSYPDKNLAGVGVVFKLIQALLEKAGKAAQLPHYLKLVSIGTVADIVSLRKENRLIVKYGLEALSQVANPGLRSLMEVSGLDGKRISVGDVGFRIGPRINAAGRLGKADMAVRLFFTDSEEESRRIALEMNDLNSQRQSLERKIFDEAFQMVEEGALDKRYKLLILGREGWHRGVIGIVASKLKDCFYRPVIMFAYENGRAYGSGRSIREFPLIDCLNSLQQHFFNYGGHPMAVGCELDCANMESFKQSANAYVADRISAEDLTRKIRIDSALEFAEIDERLLRFLSLLSPFGAGNPKPVFATEEVELTSSPRVMQNRHLKLFVKKDGRVFEALGWGKAKWAEALTRGDHIDLAYGLQVSEYLGEERLQLILEDIRTPFSKNAPA
jgi:single-stranded-DNA-specific exonuclease